MSIFFDSPIEYCPVAKRYVLIDQTRESCSEDMNCRAVNCPLARYFARPMRADEKPAGTPRKPVRSSGT